MFVSFFLWRKEERRGRRRRSSLWLVVGENTKKGKKRKRKDETKGPATPHYVLLTMENVLLFRVKFSSP